MAAKKILDLLVDIETNGIKTLDKASESFTKLNKKTNTVTKSLKAFAGASSKMAAGIAPAVAGLTALTVGFAAATTKALSSADKIAKTADKIGLTTDALQELRFAAGLSGVESKTLDMAMQRFSRRVGEAAKGTGVLAKVFEEYNIKTKDSAGNMRSLEAILGDYANVIQGAKTDQEKLLLAFKAFDSEGAAMVNMVRNGKDGLDQYRQSARDTGQIVKEDLLRGSEAANDAIATLTGSIGVALQSALLKSAPALEEMANKLLPLVPLLQRLLEILIPMAPVFIPIIAGLTAFGLAFITIINPLIQFLPMIAGLFSGLTITIGGVIGALSVLGIGFTAIYLAMQHPEIFEAFAGYFMAAFDQIKLLFLDVKIAFDKFAEAYFVLFDKLGEIVVAFVDAFIAIIHGDLQGAIDALSAAFAGLPDAIGGVFDKLWGLINTFADFIMSSFETIGLALEAFWQSFEKPEVFTTLLGWVKATFNGIKAVILSTIAALKAAFRAVTGGGKKKSSGGGTGAPPVKKRAGGFLGGYGGGDKIRALLEAGEYVIRKEAVRSIGVGKLNDINSGRMKFADGGVVPSNGQNNTFNFSAPITATGSGMDELFRLSIIPELNKAMRRNTGSIASVIRGL